MTAVIPPGVIFQGSATYQKERGKDGNSKPKKRDI